jgi:hypothetical protein
MSSTGDSPPASSVTAKQEEEKKDSLSWKSIGEALSTLIAILVPIYFVGILTVALQIRYTYGLDSATAFHAASLVPKSDLFIVVLLSLFEDGKPKIDIILVPFFILIIVIIFNILVWLSIRVPNNPTFPNRRNIFLVTSSIVVVMLFIILIIAQGPMDRKIAIIAGNILCIINTMVFSLKKDFKFRIYTLFITNCSVLIILSAGVGAGLKPKLPTVEMDMGSGTVTGLLLSHSDGYWFIITTSSIDHELLGIPNEKAQIVGLPHKPTATISSPLELTRFGGQFHVRPPERGLSTSFQSSLVNNSRAPNGVAACCRTLR